jgi:hypothetical protein
MRVYAEMIHYDHDNIISLQLGKAFYKIHIDVDERGGRNG